MGGAQGNEEGKGRKRKGIKKKRMERKNWEELLQMGKVRRLKEGEGNGEK